MSVGPGQPVIAVTVVGVHDDGRVDIEGEDLTLTLWSHGPDRIRSALAGPSSLTEPGCTAHWRRRWLIWTWRAHGTFSRWLSAELVWVEA
jgi:hypothetical protein